MEIVLEKLLHVTKDAVAKVLTSFYPLKFADLIVLKFLYCYADFK